MTRLFILVCLLCCCGLSLTTVCRREHVVDVDFPGSDIQTLYSPDATHCQHLCTQHPTCLFFTFVRPDWTRDNRHFYCYLKSNPSGNPVVEVNLVGATSGFSLKPCSPDPEPCLSEVYLNVDFPGADYRSFFAADRDECQRECTRDPGCQFFTFVEPQYAHFKIRYKCHLKFSWTIPRPPVVSYVRARTSGFSHRLPIKSSKNCNKDCEVKLFPSTDIPSNDVVILRAASPEHCQALCSAHPLCTHFSFIGHTLTCYVKKNLDELGFRDASDDYTSGLPSRYCRPNYNWMKRIYEGVDFPHSDIRHFPLGSVDECQRSCDDDSNCQFFSYNTDARICYLKRSTTIPSPPKVTKLTNVASGFSLRTCRNF